VLEECDVLERIAGDADEVPYAPTLITE